MNPSIELIRLIAVILITFTHTRHDLSSGLLYTIVEKIPTYGTAILSIISGYLYYTVSKDKNNLWLSKIKSLLIPYLIANIGVLLLVLFANYVLGYNSLNRLSYDFRLITEGIFALNSPPINPPTYFIRDIFMVFSVIELLTKRNYYTLIVILPVLIWGTLFLRLDVVLLFGCGCLYAYYKPLINHYWLIFGLILTTALFGWAFIGWMKFPVALLLFVLMVDWKVNIGRTGRYSYLLHLYHSPIIVISFPIINKYIHFVPLNIFSQIMVAIAGAYLLYILVQRNQYLRILSGGR